MDSQVVVKSAIYEIHHFGIRAKDGSNIREAFADHLIPENGIQRLTQRIKAF